LFFIGIILLVFAGFFHIYRYGLAKAQEPPPAPPDPELEEKPKLQEPQSVSETSKLPEGSGKLEDKKELTPEIKTPKVQANLGFDVNKDTNIGSTDITKP